MKRRQFLQSLAAAFTLPAIGPGLSLPAASGAVSASVAVPTKARFWAVYMSGLHGECTPQTLQNLLHIPGTDAKRYIGQLVAEGVIKPNPLLQQSVSKVLKESDDSVLENVKKRSEMKSSEHNASKLEMAEEESAEVLEDEKIKNVETTEAFSDSELSEEENQETDASIDHETTNILETEDELAEEIAANDLGEDVKEHAS